MAAGLPVHVSAHDHKGGGDSHDGAVAPNPRAPPSMPSRRRRWWVPYFRAHPYRREPWPPPEPARAVDHFSDEAAKEGRRHHEYRPGQRLDPCYTVLISPGRRRLDRPVGQVLLRLHDEGTWWVFSLAIADQVRSPSGSSG